MNSFVQNIFATPLLVGRCDNFDICDKAAELAQTFRKNAQNAGLVSSQWNTNSKSSNQEDFNKYGVTSYNSGSLIDNPEWQKVVAFIYEFASIMLKEVYHGDNKLVLSNMWTTVYPPGAFVPEHVHSNSVFSGAFYVQTPPNCGNISFHDPAYLAKTMYLGRSVDLSLAKTKYMQSVEKGMMVLFPSWLPHETQPNQSTKDRIMISFNLDLEK